MKTTVTILACLRDQKQNGKCYSDGKKHDVIRRTNQMRKLKTNIPSALAEQETFSCSGRARFQKFSKRNDHHGEANAHSESHDLVVLGIDRIEGLCGSNNMLLYKEGNTERWDLTNTD